jgi:hypothetical protein
MLYRLAWEMPSAQVVDAIEQAQGPGVWPGYDWSTLDWHRVENISEDPFRQYRTLQQWALSKEQPIRNVVLERQVSEPVWETVDDVPIITSL